MSSTIYRNLMALLLIWDPHVRLATLLCIEQLSVMLSHFQQISVNLDKILQCERDVLFPGSGSSRGAHMWFQPHSFTQSSRQLYWVISNKFQSLLIKFYSVNAIFYFQGPALDVEPTCNSSHAVLHRVAPSYTESSTTNFSQFR